MKVEAHWHQNYPMLILYIDVTNKISGLLAHLGVLSRAAQVARNWISLSQIG